MAEFVGTLSAGMQIADGLFRLSKSIHRCIKTMVNAPEEVRKFRRETLIFSNNLRDFHDVASAVYEELDPQDPDAYRMEQTVGAIITQAQEIQRGFTKLLRRIKDSQGFFGRLTWWLQHNSVRVLESTLNCVKLNVIMVTTTFNCRILQGKVDKLKRENKEVPKALRKQMYAQFFFYHLNHAPQSCAIVWQVRELTDLSASLQRQLRTQNNFAEEEQNHLHMLLVTNRQDRGALIERTEMGEILSAERIIERFVEKKVEELGIVSASSRRTNSSSSATMASGRRSSRSSRSPRTPATGGVMEARLPNRSVDHRTRPRTEEVPRTKTLGRAEEGVTTVSISQSRPPQGEAEGCGCRGDSELISPINIANSNDPERNSADSANLSEDVASLNAPMRPKTVGQVIYDNNQGLVQEVYREWRSESLPTDLEETGSQQEEIINSSLKHGNGEGSGSNNSTTRSKRSKSSTTSAREERVKSEENRESGRPSTRRPTRGKGEEN
jgi:hypothetical protein